MPSPSQFKKALKLENGCTLGTSGAMVTESRIGHQTKRTAALYHFPSILSITWPQRMPLSDIKRRLVGDLVDLKKRECIAHSAYGSPYTCSIARAKVVKLDCRDKTATIELLGVAKRRKDLPKLRAGLDGVDPQGKWSKIAD
jgi:hypothetical protein